MIHRLGKRAGALRPELRQGDIELFLTAADGFIRGDQLFLGQLIQGI